MRFRLGELADTLGARLGGASDAAAAVVFDGASIDSRTVADGQLFVPLVAERDGHDFIEGARARGAVAWLTESGRPSSDVVGAINVEDTEAALRTLGAIARGRLPERVIGITGSAGKTSTKDLLASILRVRGSAAASEKSFNNELGVPLTLLNAPDDAWAAVIEMGARGKGHIASLCVVARPTVGVITNIGTAHLELFESQDATADAKSELLDALPPSGTAVLNFDDLRFGMLAARSGAPIVAFSATGAQGAQVRAFDVSLDDELRPRFTLELHGERFRVEVAARGAHQVANACAAAAAAAAVGATADEIAAGLASAPLSGLRMELQRTHTGARIINDTYNANPSSMKAALDALAALDASRRVALLGPMAELGPDSDALHTEVARHAHSLGVDVIAVGTRAYGPDAGAVADQFADAVTVLGPIGSGDAILIKASRSAGLERLAELLLGGSK